MTEKTLRQKAIILNNMQLNNEYKVEEIAEWLEVGRTRARTLLKMLVAEDEILETGVTKMKRYKISK